MKYIKHLPLALFTSFCLKYLVIPMGYTDIMLLVVLASTSAFFEYNIFNKEFRDFKEEYNNHKKEYNEKIQELQEIKSNLNGIKIGQSLRGTKIG